MGGGVDFNLKTFSPMKGVFQESSSLILRAGRPNDRLKGYHRHNLLKNYESLN